MAFNFFQQYVNIIIDLCTYPKKVNGRHAVLSVGSLQRSFTDVFEHSAQHIAAASRFGIFYDMLYCLPSPIFSLLSCRQSSLLRNCMEPRDASMTGDVTWTSVGHHMT